MVTADVYWTCLDCGLVGSTDRTAEKHTPETTHATVTSTDPARLARMLDERAQVGS